MTSKKRRFLINEQWKTIFGVESVSDMRKLFRMPSAFESSSIEQLQLFVAHKLKYKLNL